MGVPTLYNLSGPSLLGSISEYPFLSLDWQLGLDFKLVEEPSLGKGGLQWNYPCSTTTTGRDAAFCMLTLTPQILRGT